jgi:CRISPR system Cascade subunit CasC
VRTKYVVDLVKEELEKLGYNGDAESAISEALNKVELKTKKGKNSDKLQLDALFFISHMQAKKIAEIIVEQSGKNRKLDSKATEKEYVKKIENALNEEPSIDMVLFGRMAASNASLNFDAVAQVAHSISTHEIRNEYDYFTAVDDHQEKDSTGAAFLDTVEFNSSTLYRYATVNVRELEKSLKFNTTEAVQGFVKAFLLSMPTGKQNSFANRTVPDFAYIAFRTDQPVNLAGAFEKPIYTRQEGYVDKSVQALKEFALKNYEAFVMPPAEAYCIGRQVEELGREIALNDLMMALEKEIRAYCEEE